MKKNIALIVGGYSSEKAVSLLTQDSIEKGLIEANYNVKKIEYSNNYETFKSALSPKPDAAFINVLGKGGEDGTLQNILEKLEIPYTHSGVEASAIGMNKKRAKAFAKKSGVSCAEDVLATKKEI